MMIPREVIGARLSGSNAPAAKMMRVDHPLQMNSPKVTPGEPPVTTSGVRLQARTNQGASPVMSLPPATSPVTAAAVPSVPASCPPRSGTPAGAPTRDGYGSTAGNPLSLREKLGRFVTPGELSRVNALGTEGMIDTFLDGLSQVKRLEFFPFPSSGFDFVYVLSSSLSVVVSDFHSFCLLILKGSTA